MDNVRGTIYLSKERKEKPFVKRLASFAGKACLGIALLGLFVYSTSRVLARTGEAVQRVRQTVRSYFFVSSDVSLPAHSVVSQDEDPASLPFSILIPKIELQAQVIANIDASNPDSYAPALKRGVAHALGSAFPGQGKMIFIFGHSTDYVWNVETYNALFYQIKDLEKGDSIYLTLGNTKYRYTVYEQKIVEPHNLEDITQTKNRDILILQTCYPPGTVQKRLLVFAETET